MNCIVCGHQVIPAYGVWDKQALLVGPHPQDEDFNAGVPFFGPYGDVLKNELLRCGVSFQQLRSTYYWGHYPPKKGTNTYAKEFEWHMKRLYEEMKQARYILLMGAEPVSDLAGVGVSSVNGMIVTGELLPKTATVMACLSPGAVAKPHSTIGEFRFAIEMFTDLIKGEVRDE